MDVRLADDAALPAARRLVDRVFLASRGRSGSVGDRFPGLLDERGDGDVVAAFDGSELVGMAVLRDITLDDGRRWRATAVGLVATREDWRGRGVAGRVLQEVRRELQRRGADLGVLWAGRHDLYAAHGWLPADPGVRGVAPGDPLAARSDAVTLLDPVLDALDVLDALGVLVSPQTPVRVGSGPERFRAIPPPADRVVIHVCGAPAAPVAYAVVGEQGSDAYAYEVVGEPAAFAALWDSIRAGHERVIVNDRRDGDAQRWLAGTCGVVFEPQNLALWLRLTTKADAAPIDRWHIPWLDRI